jgi:hypothetical protein
MWAKHRKLFQGGYDKTQAFRGNRGGYFVVLDRFLCYVITPADSGSTNAGRGAIPGRERDAAAESFKKGGFFTAGFVMESTCHAPD